MICGTFNISRALWDDDAFANDPFSEREAWVWMIGEAAWKPRSRRIGQVVVHLERGQLAGSIRFFADAWQWSPTAVHRFLDKLKRRGMIDVEASRSASIITLRRYDDYQGKGARGHVPAEQGGAETRNTGGTPSGTPRESVTPRKNGAFPTHAEAGGTPNEGEAERARNTGGTNENPRNPLEEEKDDGGDARMRARDGVQGGVSDSPEKTDPPQPPPVDATFRERMLAAMGVGPSGVTGPNGRMLGTTLDMHEAARWLALGLTPDEVVAQIADAMTRKRDTGPPASFRYFTEPMRRLAAVKAQPPLTPATLSDPPQGEHHAGRTHQPAAYRHPERAAARHEQYRTRILGAALGTTPAPDPAGGPGSRDPRAVLGRGGDT